MPCKIEQLTKKNGFGGCKIVSISCQMLNGVFSAAKIHKLGLSASWNFRISFDISIDLQIREHRQRTLACECVCVQRDIQNSIAKCPSENIFKQTLLKYRFLFRLSIAARGRRATGQKLSYHFRWPFV